MVGRWAKAASAFRRRWNLPMRAPPVRSYIHMADPMAPSDLAGHHAVAGEDRDHEGQDAHEVRGVAPHAMTFAECFVDEPDLALLEVTETAVGELRALRRRARTEVVAFDERSGEAP